MACEQLQRNILWRFLPPLGPKFVCAQGPDISKEIANYNSKLTSILNLYVKHFILLVFMCLKRVM